MSENLSPFAAETPTGEAGAEDYKDKKDKKKKKALGAFLVETPEPKKEENIWTAKKSKDQSESTEVSEHKLFSFTKSAEIKKDTESILEPEEQLEVVRRLAAARQTEIDQAQPDLAPELQAENDAAAAYLAEAARSGSIEDAFDQVNQSNDLEATDLNEPESSSQAEVAEQTIYTQNDGQGEINLNVSHNEEENEPNTYVAPPASAKPTAASAGGSSSNGGNLPPLPPASVPPLPFGQGPNNFGNNTNKDLDLSPTPHTYTPGVEQHISHEASLMDERRALSEGLVTGAIVGYLYGRRRGRIKTEKRLAPLQKKLEKQVKSLQTELLNKEALVRQQARQQNQTLLGLRVEQSIAQKTAPSEQKASQQAVPERAAPVLRSATIEYRQLTSPERPISHAVVPPEQIGHVLMAASAESLRLTEPNTLPKKEIMDADKQSQIINRADLLSLSEKIMVDGTSLRKVYETQLVSEKGLRRLVAEHLRGGNLARALKRELVEREIDFERDPIFRDKAHSDRDQAKSAKSAIASLLARNGHVPITESIPIGTPIKEPETDSTKPQATKTRKQSQAIIDVSLVVLISFLIIVIILVLTRNR